jgi:hypothetical protein
MQTMNFDPNSIKYEEFREYKNKPGIKHVPIKYNGEILVIETPLAISPEGVVGNDNWTLEIKLDPCEFTTMMKIIDQKNREHLRHLTGCEYKPLIDDSIFKTVFPLPYIIGSRHNKSFITYVRGDQKNWYNEKCKSPVCASWNKKNMSVKQKIYCTGLWITDERAYCEFKIKEIHV